jgi:hypothetical protein
MCQSGKVSKTVKSCIASDGVLRTWLSHSPIQRPTRLRGYGVAALSAVTQLN